MLNVGEQSAFARSAISEAIEAAETGGEL